MLNANVVMYIKLPCLTPTVFGMTGLARGSAGVVNNSLAAEGDLLVCGAEDDPLVGLHGRVVRVDAARVPRLRLAVIAVAQVPVKVRGLVCVHGVGLAGGVCPRLGGLGPLAVLGCLLGAALGHSRHSLGEAHQLYTRVKLFLGECRHELLGRALIQKHVL